MTKTTSRGLSSQPENLKEIEPYYSITDIRPELPCVHLESSESLYDCGWTESWDEHRKRWFSAEQRQLMLESAYRHFMSDRDIIISFLVLDRDLCNGTHKRLYGFVTDTPTTEAVRACAFALFAGPGRIYTTSTFDGSWKSYLRKLEKDHKRASELKAFITSLLSELEG